MPRVVYIGKESKYVGKCAFQILGNLKNFGVGRMITRHEFDAFPEPSFHIVRRAEPKMDPKLEHGTIWCETVYRGKRLPGIRPIDTSFVPDYRLVSKEDEHKYLNYPIKNLGDSVKVLPKYYNVPPLMKEFMIRRFKKVQELSGESQEYYDDKNRQFKIPFVYQTEKDAKKENGDLFWIEHRIARDDNEVNVDFDGKFHFNDEYKAAIENYSKSN